MKSNDLIVLALAGVAVFMLLRSRQSAGVTQSKSVNMVDDIINTALPGQPGWGWQYFENGTAISPSGEYFYQGASVWKP